MPTPYPGTVYRYFSIDADHDISADTLNLGLTAATVTTAAAYVPVPSAGLLAAPPAVAKGYTRYWWRLLMGTGQTLPLYSGPNIVLGILTETPEEDPHKWEFSLPYYP